MPIKSGAPGGIRTPGLRIRSLSKPAPVKDSKGLECLIVSKYIQSYALYAPGQVNRKKHFIRTCIR